MRTEMQNKNLQLMCGQAKYSIPPVVIYIYDALPCLEAFSSIRSLLTIKFHFSTWLQNLCFQLLLGIFEACSQPNVAKHHLVMHSIHA